MNKMAVYTISLGCPKNLVDTEKMLGQLSERYTIVDRLEQTHIVLINTCSFIQPAVEESIQTILYTAEQIKDLHPRPLLIVTGCLLARYGREELQKELPEVDLWLDFKEQNNWLQNLKQKLRLVDKISTQSILDVTRSIGNQEKKKAPYPRILSTPPGVAYLKISEGCNHRCRFCLIPKIRGPLRSRPVDKLKDEARYLLDSGVQELCLIAQDVTSYGKDLHYKNGLIQLLEELCSLSGLHWIRILYMYPTAINQEMLVSLREFLPFLLPYFDVPFQHVHPDILAWMGRPFSRDPHEVVAQIRDVFPEACLRTTIIVGYPGETSYHFESLMDFVRKSRFHHLGVFPFYPEEGTKSAKFENQVPYELMEERRKELMELQAEISTSKLASYQGKKEKVIIDRIDPEWPTLYQGRTWFQALEIDGITYVSGYNLRPGQLVKAQILETKTYDLVALA